MLVRTQSILAILIIGLMLSGCATPENPADLETPPVDAVYERHLQLYRTCQVRRRFVEDWVLHYHQKEQKGIAPYVNGLPGYGMFALMSDQRRNMADVNCCHGARFRPFGGWQAVNLPPSTWTKLQAAWTAAGESGGIPFAWCGKATGVDRRALFSARVEDGAWSAFFAGHVEEAELTRQLSVLNEVLTGMDETPINMDVPDGVRWEHYRMKDKKR